MSKAAILEIFSLYFTAIVPHLVTVFLAKYCKSAWYVIPLALVSYFIFSLIQTVINLTFAGAFSLNSIVESLSFNFRSMSFSGSFVWIVQPAAIIGLCYWLFQRRNGA